MGRKPLIWVAATIAIVALVVAMFGAYRHSVSSRERKQLQIRDIAARMHKFKTRATVVNARIRSQAQASQSRDADELRDLIEQMTRLAKERRKLEMELRESDVRKSF